MRLKLNDSQDGKFYFELQAGGNYETLMTSETYDEKTDAEAAIDMIFDEPVQRDEYIDATSTAPVVVVEQDDEAVSVVHRMTPEPDSPMDEDPMMMPEDAGDY